MFLSEYCIINMDIGDIRSGCLLTESGASINKYSFSGHIRTLDCELEYASNITSFRYAA